MSTNFELNVEPREALGTAASRRLRRTNKVPVVVYGAGSANRNYQVDHDKLRHQLAVEAFHSAIIDVVSDTGSEQAILRAVQVHAYKPRILHLDLQRVRATDKLHISVPLHFTGEEMAPGVKTHAGIVSRLVNEVDVACLPSDLPEYLGLDIAALDLNESLHLSDIKLPKGVEITSLAHGGEDLAVVSVLAPKVEVETGQEEEGSEVGGAEAGTAAEAEE